MATTILKTVDVATAPEMNKAMMYYLAQGFVVTSQTADTTTLNKTPSIVWSFNEVLAAIFLTFLCVVPGLLYIRSAYKRHGTIENLVIHVDPAAAALAVSPASAADVVGFQLSDDSRYWWNSTEWVDCALTVPPNAQYSDDQSSWWDGHSWRLTPTGAAPAALPPSE